MRRHEVKDSHVEWLEDIEYRQEFGWQTAKLEVAAALADAREAVGMTESALAERAGVSQAYIAKLERGDANPTIGHIGRLLAYMGLNPSVNVAPIEPAASSESVLVKDCTASRVEAVYYWRGELTNAHIPDFLDATWRGDPEVASPFC